MKTDVSNGRKTKVTIIDVAKKAGVVPSTVSHVINGTASITAETRERVLQAIADLNYAPNASARALRHNKTGLIGVALQNASIEFYTKCTAYLQREARKDKKVLLIMDADFDNDVLREQVEAMIERRVEGLIFIGGANDEDILESVVKANIPIVLGDRHSERFLTTEFNNEETIFNLTMALYESGYRRFAYLGESLNVQSNLADRYAGFTKALDSCNVPESDRTVILSGDLHIKKLHNAYNCYWKEFLDSDGKIVPDVIVTSNDLTAQGLIAAYQQHGYNIPEDVAIVGFDDIEVSQYFHPALTTITQNEKDLALSCYRQLKNVIKDKEVEQHVVLKQRIVGRDSAKILPDVLEKYQPSDITE